MRIAQRFNVGNSTGAGLVPKGRLNSTGESPVPSGLNPPRARTQR
jgi:hypothetical protein